MKKLVIMILLAGNFSMLYGQLPNSSISMLRYNDDFSAVKSDTVKNGWNRLKYIPLSAKATISFGGEIREQYQYFQNQNFGDVPTAFKKVSVAQLWHRIMAHSNIELGQKIRVFIQLSSTFRFFNPNMPAPEIDENRLSLHQLFIDYSVSRQLLIRVGKQELGYGNNRLLTFREGPNTRLAFNGAIVKYSSSRRKIDVLAVTPVISKLYAFDDVSFKEYAGGFYATENFIPSQLMVDYYFLYFTSAGRQYNFISGKEKRKSYGVRLFSQRPVLNYELEITGQSGSFNNAAIVAYGLSADIHYKLFPKQNFIAGAGLNYFTGDKSETDDRLHTYNLIFSKPSYGLAAPVGSSNIINFNPYLRINPVKKLSVYAGVYIMKRQSNRDGTYSPGMVQVRPTPGNLFVSSKKQIGTQYALETNYDHNQHFYIAADAAFFKAGSYVKETGKGSDITYLSIKAGYKF